MAFSDFVTHQNGIFALFLERLSLFCVRLGQSKRWTLLYHSFVFLHVCPAIGHCRLPMKFALWYPMCPLVSYVIVEELLCDKYSKKPLPYPGEANPL